jgi:hypothetical protein
MLKFALTALIIAAGSLAQAQDGPSYEETVRFLQGKFREFSQNNWNSFSSHIVEVDQCRFVLFSRSEVTSGLDVGRVHISIDFFNARDLDPSRVYTDTQNSIEAWATEGRDLIMSMGITNRPETTANPSHYSRQNCHDVYNDIYSHPRVNPLISISEGQMFCSSESLFGSNRTIYISANSIITPANENVPRVQRAIQHLIGLCGGQEELF